VGLPCFASAVVKGRNALSHWFFVAGFVGVHAQCAERDNICGLLCSVFISALDRFTLLRSHRLGKWPSKALAVALPRSELTVPTADSTRSSSGARMSRSNPFSDNPFASNTANTSPFAVRP